MMHTTTVPRVDTRNRNQPTRGGLLALLAVALLLALLLLPQLTSSPSGQALPVPADLFLSGTVGGHLLIDDPASIDAARAAGVLAIEVRDPVYPLRIAFEPGIPVTDNVLFDLAAYPLLLELRDGDAPGRTFVSSEGELTVIDGAVHISARLYDDSGASQFLGARIDLTTP